MAITGNTQIGLELDLQRLRQSKKGRKWLQDLEQVYLRLSNRKLRSLVNKGRRLSVVVPIGELPISNPVRQNRLEAHFHLPAGISTCSYAHGGAEVNFSAVYEFRVIRKLDFVAVTTARHHNFEVSDDESLSVFDERTGSLLKKSPLDSVGCLIPRVRTEPIRGTEFTRDLGWWYGALVSDGWLGNGMIGYAKNETAKRDEFRRLAAKCFDAVFLCDTYSEDGSHPNKYGRSTKIHLRGSNMRDAVMECYGIREAGRAALFKSIPAELLSRGSRKCLLGLLAGILDGDSTLGWNHFNDRPRAVCVSHTSSKLLVEDLRRLGRLLGIRVSVTTTRARNRSQTAYTMCWSLPDVAAIADELQLVGKGGRQWLAQFMQNPVTRDDRDIVPVAMTVAERLAGVMWKLGEHTLYAACRKAKRTFSLGRQTAERVASLSRAELRLDLQWQAFFRVVQNSDVHWDRVSEVERIPRQGGYDLDVPETGTFMIQQGIVI